MFFLKCKVFLGVIMLLHVIFLQYISIVSASYDPFSSLTEVHKFETYAALLRRVPRLAKAQGAQDNSITCDDMSNTETSPYVVIMLFKTSGRYLGLGSIIDKRTVLSAFQVVDTTMKKPEWLLVLAGRLNPWWGKDSQVQPASEITVIDSALAIVSLKHDLRFSKYVKPIGIPGPHDANTYSGAFAVFGIQRTGWDVQGESIPKGAIYVMRPETTPIDATVCKTIYPDYDYNSTTMMCTFANGTWSWGCLGSPSLGLTETNQLIQVGVLVKATTTDKDEYHFHILLTHYDQFIRAHSLLGFQK